MTKNTLYLLLPIFCVAACGVRFNDATNQNAAIPTDFSSRTFYNQPHQVRIDLEHHLGSLWLERIGPNNEPQLIESTFVIVPNGFTPSAQVPLYPASASSEVDASFAAKGSYASLISAGLSGTMAISFHLVDTLEAFIPEDKIPNDLIAQFETGNDGHLATLLRQAKAGDTIVYARMLTLSTITKKNSTSQDANGTANSPVYQVNSSLHAEASDTIVDYMVGVDFRPIATVIDGPTGLIINTHAGDLLREQTEQAQAQARNGSLKMTSSESNSVTRTEVLPGSPVRKFRSAYPGLATFIWKPPTN